MPVKDEFSYSAKWDSVGLSCGFCKHQKNAEKWPNIERNYSCGLHGIPLRIELRESGYLKGGWFCKSFDDNGDAYPAAVSELNKFKDKLEEGILYAPVRGPFLKEVSFKKLNDYL